MAKGIGMYLVIGGGYAAVSVVAGLRKRGWSGSIGMISDEATLPYQRPPLSKGYLKGALARERLPIRPAEWYAGQKVTLWQGRAAVGIDRAAKRVALADGTTIDYDKLVLATGARARSLAASFTRGAENVLSLRSLSDSDRLAGVLSRGAVDVVVVGGGYIGLEVAATARSLGCRVTVLEAGVRILARVAAEETADYLRRLHQSHGVEIHEGVTLADGAVVDGRMQSVTLKDGRRFPCDLLVVGIGAEVNGSLAVAAGLAVAGGIVVDDHGCTADPDIYAAGDCTVFPYRGAPTRLESVQNANDQATVVAANMVGGDEVYDPAPWFWSDQFEASLQIAGLNRGFDLTVVRRTSRGQSVWYFAGDTLLAVDAINDPKAYGVGKKLLAAGRSPDRKALADSTLDLKGLV